MKTNGKNKPVFEARLNQIRVTVWENTTDKGTWFNTSIIRRYQDGDGVWQDSHVFSGLGDLALLIECAHLAKDFIRDAEQGFMEDNSAEGE